MLVQFKFVIRGEIQNASIKDVETAMARVQDVLSSMLSRYDAEIDGVRGITFEEIDHNESNGWTP